MAELRAPTPLCAELGETPSAGAHGVPALCPGRAVPAVPGSAHRK